MTHLSNNKVSAFVIRQFKRPLKLIAARVALLAIVLQVLMPLGQGMAQAAAFDRGPDASSGVVVICTQFGMELRIIHDDGNAAGNGTQTQMTWDCPVCQLQIGANVLSAPEQAIRLQVFPNAQPTQFAQIRIIVPTALSAKPNAPRAPPKA
ncbi:MAG: DUF2946 domain-containing protein [Rhodospirillaceae bacterium]|nr:DUF2946 domain-containing protein [Rhodospirillaceae bacterium]